MEALTDTGQPSQAQPGHPGAGEGPSAFFYLSLPFPSLPLLKNTYT